LGHHNESLLTSASEGVLRRV